MNTDSKEITAILNRVPRWHYLTPGVDVWQEGDEADEYGWAVLTKDADGCGQPVITSDTGRRPIPETVRRSMAFWWLHGDDIDKAILSISPSEMLTYLNEGDGAYMRWAMEGK